MPDVLDVTNSEAEAIARTVRSGGGIVKSGMHNDRGCLCGRRCVLLAGWVHYKENNNMRPQPFQGFCLGPDVFVAWTTLEPCKSLFVFITVHCTCISAVIFV